MPSAKSYFNPTLLRKNLTRCWPFWAACLLGALLILPLSMWQNLNNGVYYADYHMESLAEISSSMAIGLSHVMPAIACVLSLVAALLLFHYLFQARSVNFYHALPIRREGLFLTGIVSGLIMLWVPAILSVGVTVLVELSYDALDLTSLAQLLLLYLGSSLFFFGLAVLCTHMTGWFPAAAALYVVANGVVWVVYTVLTMLLGELILGVTTAVTPDWVMCFTPVVRLCMIETEMSAVGHFERLTEMGLIAGYTLAGIALLGLSMLAYHYRRSESAGDLLAFGWMKPLFKVLFTFCSGCTLGLITSGIYELSPYFTVPFWAAICWLVAEMLVRRTVKVFRRRIFLHGGAFVLSLAALLLLLSLDFFGIYSRVPQADEVAWVRVEAVGYDGVFTGEQIAAVTELHSSLVSNREELEWAESDYGSRTRIELEYMLKNGSRFSRRYYVCDPGGPETNNTDALLRFLREPEQMQMLVFSGHLEQSELCMGRLAYWSEADQCYYEIELSRTERFAIYQAIDADIAAGAFYNYVLAGVGEIDGMDIDVELVYIKNGESHRLHFTVRSNMENTLACAEQLIAAEENNS